MKKLLLQIEKRRQKRPSCHPMWVAIRVPEVLPAANLDGNQLDFGVQ